MKHMLRNLQLATPCTLLAGATATASAQASGGKMKVTASPLQKLGSEAQVINRMQAGAVQFAVFTAAGLANCEEPLLGWSLPYVFKDVAHAAHAAQSVQAWLNGQPLPRLLNA